MGGSGTGTGGSGEPPAWGHARGAPAGRTRGRPHTGSSPPWKARSSSNLRGLTGQTRGREQDTEARETGSQSGPASIPPSWSVRSRGTRRSGPREFARSASRPPLPAQLVGETPRGTPGAVRCPRACPEAGPFDPGPPGRGAPPAYARRRTPLRAPGTPPGGPGAGPGPDPLLRPGRPAGAGSRGRPRGRGRDRGPGGGRSPAGGPGARHGLHLPRGPERPRARRPARGRPHARPGQDLPDELRIAQQLSDWNFC